MLGYVRHTALVVTWWVGTGCVLDIDRGRLSPDAAGDAGDADGAEPPDADGGDDAAAGDEGATGEDAGDADDAAEADVVPSDRPALVLLGDSGGSAMVAIVDSTTMEAAVSPMSGTSPTEIWNGLGATVLGLRDLGGGFGRLYRFRRSGTALVRVALLDTEALHPTGATELTTGEIAVTFGSWSKIAFRTDDLRGEIATVSIAAFASPLEGDDSPDATRGVESGGVLWIALQHFDRRPAAPAAVAPGTLIAVDASRRTLIDLDPGTAGTVDGIELPAWRPGVPLALDPDGRRLLIPTTGPDGTGDGGGLVVVDSALGEAARWPALDDGDHRIIDVRVFPAVGRGWALLALTEGNRVVSFDLSSGERGVALAVTPWRGYLIAPFGEDRLAVIDTAPSEDAVLVFDAASGEEQDLPAVSFVDRYHSACWMAVPEGT